MTEVPPDHHLSAESLQPIYPGWYNGVVETLTPRMASRWMTSTRTFLIATRRPLYVPGDTSAEPPDLTSTEFSEQSGMCMDVGIV